MRQLRPLLLLSLSLLALPALPCTDIFISKGGYHVEGRTMDFPINIAFGNMAGFIGQKNTTDVVLDANKIPQQQLTSWTNRYGYFGRSAFDGPKMVDGVNTQGLSVAALYLPGTQYPVYNSNDQRPVLAIYDLINYLLSQARNVNEAVKLIRSHQLVQSAVEMDNGTFLKDIPIHEVLRDKKGNSAVVEFLNGQVKVYEHAGDVLTNNPPLDWQLQHAQYYGSLLLTNNHPNPKFAQTIYDYNQIYQSAPHSGEINLIGLPGDYTSPSRFVRTKVLLNNLPTPDSKEQALYQTRVILGSVTVPAFSDSSATIWSTIKDLDNQVVYLKDEGYFQAKGKLYPAPISDGYTAFNLKAIDFNHVPMEYKDSIIAPADPKLIKKILSAENVPAFSTK